jgi:hypothetical protein
MARITESTISPTVNTAEEAVQELVVECRKGGPLYKHAPQAVAQVSRTSKWLLNAITRLRRTLETADTDNARK